MRLYFAEKSNDLTNWFNLKIQLIDSDFLYSVGLISIVFLKTLLK